MFVRIVKGRLQSLYECDRYHITPIGGHDRDEFCISLELDSSPRSVNVNIDRSQKKTFIVAMNNEGRTIDMVYKSKD